MSRLRKILFVLALSLCAHVPLAAAQSLPVQVSVSGDTAVAHINSLQGIELAEVTLAFEDVSGLSAGSLGLSANLVQATNLDLLKRLPGSLTQLDSAFPLLVTIEPPSTGGLSFRSVRVEVHTHALGYAVGSSYRLFKAPLGGKFRDITDEIAPGSIRARGTTGGFSQFLVLPDLRPSGDVVDEKIASLRTRVAQLPASEKPAFQALLDTAEDAVDVEDFDGAIVAIDAIRARAEARAGTYIADEWRATRDVENHAGDLIAGAATLKFSVAYLRDFGQ